MSYKSPIEIIDNSYDAVTNAIEEQAKRLGNEIDNMVVKACVKVGCVVDKDELVKALQYDRDQYEKGYADGLRDAASPWHMAEEPPKGYGAFAACCVYYGKIYWFKAIYLDGKWLREMDGVELPVNYWMEIPEPPKEEQ